jgi:hypothetical protein
MTGQTFGDHDEGNDVACGFTIQGVLEQTIMKLWKLTYRVGNTAQTLVEGPYPVCVAKQNQLKDNLNYRLGTWKIEFSRLA